MDSQNISTQPAQIGNNKNPKTKVILLVTCLAVIVLVIAYFVSAYFFNLWPFTADPKTLFTKSFDNLLNVNTTSYEVKASLKAQDKEKDAETLSADLLQYTTSQQPMYDRDNDRMRGIGIIKGKLFPDQRVYIPPKKVYFPASLALAGAIIKDPSGNPYDYKAINGQQDFNLTVTFETQDAVDSITSAYYYNNVLPKVNGKMVTFNKDSLVSFNSYTTLAPKLPSFINLISSLNDTILYLPSDTNINLNINGLAQSKGNSVPNTRLSASVNADFSDMSYKVAAEMLKKDQDIYFKLDSFPSLFLGNSLDKIKQKWIQVGPDDLTAYGVNDFVQQDNNLKQQVLQQIKSSFSLAISDGALLGSDKADVQRINGKNYYRYTLSLNKDKVKGFYKDLTDSFNKQFGDSSLIKFDQTTYDYMRSPAFDKLYDYMSKNIKFYYYADPITGYPYMFEYRVRLVPDAKNSSFGGFFGSQPATDKEFILTLDISLTDINKTIKIDAPKDFMSFMDAQIAMTGQSKEQYLMDKQTSNITSIQTGLYNYYLISGVYPDTLDGLKKTAKEITSVRAPDAKGLNPTALQFQIDNIKKTYADTPIMKTVPTDVYTGKSYGYTATNTQSVSLAGVTTWSADYDISFNMTLPPYVKGTMPSYSLYRNYGAYNKTTGKYDNFFDLIYKNGINHVGAPDTVYSYMSSTKPAGAIDSDGDGIADDLEIYLGTDPYNKDTDGDGVSDGDELQVGSNPLGAGKLTESY